MEPETSYLKGTFLLMGTEHSHCWHLSVSQVVNTSSENSWRARFRFADLAAAVYIAGGGHSSATIAERKNVECPVPQEVAAAKSRDLTKTKLSAQLLVAREATLDGCFAVVFVTRPAPLRAAGTGRQRE